MSGGALGSAASCSRPGGGNDRPRGFAAGEMRPNGSKSRGESGSRVWEKRKVPRFRGDDCEICRWRYFLSVKKVTKERRGFAVGAPARRSRDGNGKIAVRGGEAMAAKRTTAQGGFAQRNAAPDFARQTQKVGPVTVRAVSPQVKCDRMGARAGAGTEAACGKRGRPPLSRGRLRVSDGLLS